MLTVSRTLIQHGLLLRRDMQLERLTKKAEACQYRACLTRRSAKPDHGYVPFVRTMWLTFLEHGLLYSALLRTDIQLERLRRCMPIPGKAYERERIA